LSERVKILGSYYKQPDEVVPAGRWGVDFSSDMVAGEVITSASITVTDSSGSDVTATLTSGSEVIADGSKVSIKFVNGTDGETYTVSIEATSDAGAVYEAEFYIIVKDV